MDTMVGNRIKTIRGAKSQAQFADELGVHKNSLSRYELGKGSPNTQFLQSICTKFEIEPSWLLFGEGPMNREAAQLRKAVQDRLNGRESGGDEHDLRAELRSERELNRELMSENSKLMGENRKLMEENRKLMSENRDMAVELTEARTRAAPATSPTKAARKSA